MNVLQTWLANASIPQRDKLIKLSRTTLGGLRQLAGAYRTNGKVHATPELAALVEKAAAKIDVLPVIHREDLCPACGKCELAKTARYVQNERAAQVPK
jgi:NAD-dependent dihydropyrimidine dehydrogenase PreA subunit